MIDPKIFKAYDIRGVYPQDINEENFSDIIKAIYTFLTQEIGKNILTVSLSCDMRNSSPQLHEKAKETLTKLGAQVKDLGLASTPTLYYAVTSLKTDAGIQITASHNPSQYNGMKIVRRTEKGLIKIGKSTGMEKIKEIAVAGNFVNDLLDGKIEEIQNIVEKEVANARSITNTIDLKPIKAVADTANAMGALYLNELFTKINGELIKLNFELDGNFPAHEADPLKFETLKELQAKVISEKAEIGIATDGDADRTFFVDEKGNIIPASLITSLAIREFLKTNPGETVVCDIRYLMNARKVTADNGGKLVISKVGHAFITELSTQENAIFSGESSGHYFFCNTGFAESSAAIVLTIFKIMSASGKTISQLVEEVKSAFESGEINFEVTDAKPILEELTKLYADGQLSTLDGISIEYPDWRFGVRTSNTEPLMRLNLEAINEQLMLEKKQELVAKILELGGKIK